MAKSRLRGMAVAAALPLLWACAPPDVVQADVVVAAATMTAAPAADQSDGTAVPAGDAIEPTAVASAAPLPDPSPTAPITATPTAGPAGEAATPTPVPAATATVAAVATAGPTTVATPAATAVPATPTVVVEPGLIAQANGAEIYTNKCARCHAESGLGTFEYAGIIGVSSKYTTASLIQELTFGHPVTFGFADTLSAEEIASVVAYVLATF